MAEQTTSKIIELHLFAIIFCLFLMMFNKNTYQIIAILKTQSIFTF